MVSGEWYNCGIWFYLPLKVARGDVHSRGGLGRRGILSPSSLWQICWLVFEVCDKVQLLFLLSNYKIIYHDIIFCTNQSNHYKTSPLRVRYLQIYQQSHYVKIHFLTQVFCKLYLIIFWYKKAYMYLTTAAKGLLTATIIMMFIFAYT